MFRAPGSLPHAREKSPAMAPEPPNNERRVSWRPSQGRRFPGDRRASATPHTASGSQVLPETPEAPGIPQPPEIPGITDSPAPGPVPALGLGGVVVLGLIALLLPSAITWLAFPLHIPLCLLDSPAGPGSANLPAWSLHVLAGAIGALFVGSLLRRAGSNHRNPTVARRVEPEHFGAVTGPGTPVPGPHPFRSPCGTGGEVPATYPTDTDAFRSTITTRVTAGRSRIPTR